MKKALLHLVEEAIYSQVSDIHFVCENELVIYFRYLDGIKKVHYPYNEKLFEYLKFISNLDIAIYITKSALNSRFFRSNLIKSIKKHKNLIFFNLIFYNYIRRGKKWL